MLKIEALKPPTEAIKIKVSKRICITFTSIVLTKLDKFKKEKGCNTRGEAINLLLELNSNGHVVYTKGKDNGLDRIKPLIKEVKGSGNTSDFKAVITELNNTLKEGGKLQKVPTEELEKIKAERNERLELIKKKFKIETKGLEVFAR